MASSVQEERWMECAAGMCEGNDELSDFVASSVQEERWTECAAGMCERNGE